MITGDMKTYNIYGTIKDAYGSIKVDLANPIGSVKMAVYITNFDAQQNTVFASAEYVGLTKDKDLAVGQYIDLKQTYTQSGGVSGYKAAQITYIYNRGRYTQVFMKETGNIIPELPDIEDLSE